MFHVKPYPPCVITDIDQFAQLAADYGCLLSADQIRRIEALAQWLAAKASLLGLSKYDDLPIVYTSALAPTLPLCKLVDITPFQSVMDLGAGSGALGLTLSILQPHLSLNLVDRSTRAATFLELTSRRLNLTNVAIVRAQASELQQSHAHRYDLVCFRALARGDKALRLAHPFVKPGGYIAAWHQIHDPNYDNPPRQIQHIASADTNVSGLVVSLYMILQADECG